MTFKEAGDTEVTVQILAKADNSVVLEETSTFTSIAAPTLTVTKPDECKVGAAVEFSVSTTKGYYDGGNVYGKVACDDASKVEKLEYLETADGQWHEMTGDTFGPDSGFPLMDATSKFRVTFKEAGDTEVTVQILAKADNSVVLENTSVFKSVNADAPTTPTAPTGRPNPSTGVAF